MYSTAVSNTVNVVSDGSPSRHAHCAADLLGDDHSAEVVYSSAQPSAFIYQFRPFLFLPLVVFVAWEEFIPWRDWKDFGGNPANLTNLSEATDAKTATLCADVFLRRISQLMFLYLSYVTAHLYQIRLYNVYPYG